MSKVNEESLAEPPKPRARRSTIIRGAPLPNSVLTGQLKEELEQASNRIHVIQERRTQIMLEQKRLKEKYASLDVTPEIEEVDEQPESEDEKELLFIAGEHAEPEKAKQRKTKPRSSLKKKPKTKKKSGQKDSSDGEPPSDVSKEDDTTQQPAGVVPVALPVIQEIVLLVAAPVVESVDYVKSTPSLHPLPITTPESVKESTEPVIAEQPIQEPPIHPAVSQEQLEPVAPEEAKRTLLASRDRDMLLKKFRAQRAELPAQEPVMSPKLDKTFTGGVKKQDIFIKQSTLRQISKGVKPLQEPKARQVKENSMIKQQSVNLEPELSAPVFIDREEELSSEEIEIDPELEIYNPKKPWGLFSHSPNQIPSMSPHDLLKNISKKPWFPGIPKDQQISLGSVIGVLSQINDMWEARAKLEGMPHLFIGSPQVVDYTSIASICLANIYQVFKDDLKGHLDILIEAQLNLMNDESAQVRSIATSMLPTYNKPNDTVKAALISKLADPSEVVRYSLQFDCIMNCGINASTQAIRPHWSPQNRYFFKRRNSKYNGVFAYDKRVETST